MGKIWHPFTQMKTSSPPMKVKSGRGTKLVLEDGREVIDLASSWWVNIHGHSHPVIAEAIYKQALTLEHVIFAGFTHDPAEMLAEKVLSKLPVSFSHVFFTDNGSTSVEVALKMAYQYWINRGESQRKTFICFDGAYHGDTIGAMSLAGPSIYNKIFFDLLFDVKVFGFPSAFDGDLNVFEKENRILLALKKEFEEFQGTHIALCIEPLIQAAGGMRMCRHQFIEAICDLARDNGVLILFDEVFTGFGRTGNWFATNDKVFPDILCLAKGLTGGFLPLALTCCSQKIYDAFLGEDLEKALLHGHSFTANPLGCAAALASISLLEQNEGTFKSLQSKHKKFLANFSDHPLVKNIRVSGTIAAMDIGKGRNSYANPISRQLRELFLEENILVRPLGNTLAFVPPYCITDEELEMCYTAFSSVLEKI